MAELWAAVIASGIVGTLIGTVIGYFKCRADNADKYVKKEDCIRCAEQRHELQVNVDERINKGSEMFSEIKTSIALIMQKLEAIEKRQEKRQAGP